MERYDVLLSTNIFMKKTWSIENVAYLACEYNKLDLFIDWQFYILLLNYQYFHLRKTIEYIQFELCNKCFTEVISMSKQSKIVFNS